MKTVLLGYGKTNQAIVGRYKYSQIFDIFDDGFLNTTTDEYGNTLRPSNDYNPTLYNQQVITPGIPPHHPLAKASTNLLSDYDFFKDLFPFSIFISGTNGKTTLTQMLGHLLGEKIAQTGANIGLPIASMDETKDIWICESSSFTLHYTNQKKPDIYLLLPIASDHISWHNSFDKYEKAKLKPLAQMTQHDIAILPKQYQNISTKAYCIYYDNEYDLASYFGIEISAITHKEPFLISAVLALSVQKILFDKININTINSYTLDKHKLQPLHDHKKRLWVNDSKATNISATLAAVKLYKDKPIHLILGGDAKGISLEPLIKKLQDLNTHIYAIGSNELDILALAKQYKLPCVQCTHLHNAVREIDKLHDTESVALLSPACASLDQFSSYSARGDEFVSEVEKLDK